MGRHGARAARQVRLNPRLLRSLVLCCSPRLLMQHGASASFLDEPIFVALDMRRALDTSILRELGDTQAS